MRENRTHGLMREGRREPVLYSTLFTFGKPYCFLYPFTGVQLLIHFQQMNCKHSQGAADVRRRANRRPFVLQELGNKADAVPCECLQLFI